MASFYDLYEIAKIVQEDVLKEDFNWSEDHSSKYETKRGDKDQSTGKHHVHVFYNGEKIGTISPNSTRNDKKAGWNEDCSSSRLCYEILYQL